MSFAGYPLIAQHPPPPALRGAVGASTIADARSRISRLLPKLSATTTGVVAPQPIHPLPSPPSYQTESKDPLPRRRQIIRRRPQLEPSHSIDSPSVVQQQSKEKEIHLPISPQQQEEQHPPHLDNDVSQLLASNYLPQFSLSFDNDNNNQSFSYHHLESNNNPLLPAHDVELDELFNQALLSKLEDDPIDFVVSSSKQPSSLQPLVTLNPAEPTVVSSSTKATTNKQESEAVASPATTADRRQESEPKVVVPVIPPPTTRITTIGQEPEQNMQTTQEPKPEAIAPSHPPLIESKLNLVIPVQEPEPTLVIPLQEPERKSLIPPQELESKLVTPPQESEPKLSVIPLQESKLVPSDSQRPESENSSPFVTVATPGCQQSTPPNSPRRHSFLVSSLSTPSSPQPLIAHTPGTQQRATTTDIPKDSLDSVVTVHQEETSIQESQSAHSGMKEREEQKPPVLQTVFKSPPVIIILDDDEDDIPKDDDTVQTKPEAPKNKKQITSKTIEWDFDDLDLDSDRDKKSKDDDDDDDDDDEFLYQSIASKTTKRATKNKQNDDQELLPEKNNKRKRFFSADKKKQNDKSNKRHKTAVSETGLKDDRRKKREPDRIAQEVLNRHALSPKYQLASEYSSSDFTDFGKFELDMTCDGIVVKLEGLQDNRLILGSATLNIHHLVTDPTSIAVKARRYRQNRSENEHVSANGWTYMQYITLNGTSASLMYLIDRSGPHLHVRKELPQAFVPKQWVNQKIFIALDKEKKKNQKDDDDDDF